MCVCVCRFEFSVSMVELHRRTLDVAVKNGGSILSKHKGLLGKVCPAGFPCSGSHFPVLEPPLQVPMLTICSAFCLKLQVLVDLSGDDISRGCTQW